MPRDANGNVTLPAGNPVVSGTLITDEWANTTMEDVRQMLQDSLSRGGSGGALQPLELPDGAVGSPSITFSNDPDSGFYLGGEGDIRLVIDGEHIMRWTSTGVEIWNPDTMEWEPVVPDINNLSDIESQQITVAGDLTVVFNNDINGAGIFVNGPDVDNGALLLGVDYNYDSVTKTVTLTNSLPVGTNITARRILNFNPLDIPQYPVYNTVAAVQVADLSVGTLVRTKGKVTVGDTLGGVYLIRPNQVVDGVNDFALDNGNTMILQRFSASLVGFAPVGGGSTDVQTALFAEQQNIDTLQATQTNIIASVLLNDGELADHETRIGALEAAPADTFTVFSSGEIAITAQGQNTAVAHGLGQTPRFANAYLRCKIAQHGFSVGDEILLTAGQRNDGEEDNVQVYANTANIGLITGDRYPLTIYNSSGNVAQITNANWRIVLRAIQ